MRNILRLPLEARITQGNWAFNRLRASLFLIILKRKAVGRLDGSREREHVDPGGPCPLQCPGAGLGGPGGDHIVKDDDVLAFDSAARVGGTLKAPATFLRRWSAESPTWLCV